MADTGTVSPLHLSSENFESTIADSAKKPVVVDFWAAWCGPCKMIGPIVEELANERQDITWAKLNVDSPDSKDIAMKYEIMSIPTMIIFKDGKEMDRSVGFKPKAQLEAWAATYITSADTNN